MTFWISRDKIGLLVMHVKKPIKSDNSSIFISDGVSVVLPREEYPEVTYENSPQEYKLIKK